MRSIIARFCSSRNAVSRFWRLAGGMGYVILGLIGGLCLFDDYTVRL